MTVDVSSFYPDIALLAPGCPQPIMLSAVVRAAIELCEKALCWDELLPTVAVASTDFPYTVTPPSHGVMYRFKAVNVDGVPLVSTSRRALDTKGTWQNDVGPPQYFIENQDRTLQVYPAPSATSSDLQMTVAYAPDPAATVIDASLYTNYRETILAGALKILFLQSREPWADPALAQYYGTRFDNGKTQATIDSSRGLSGSNLEVTMRPLA